MIGGIKQKAKPKLMIEEEKMEIWFKRDDTFLLPFACAFFSFTLPHTMSSPLSFVLLLLLPLSIIIFLLLFFIIILLEENG